MQLINSIIGENSIPGDKEKGPRWLNNIEKCLMESFIALVKELNEEWPVNVPNNNMNTLFGNLEYVLDGFACKLSYLVRDGNHINGKEWYRNLMHRLFSTIERGSGGIDINIFVLIFACDWAEESCAWRRYPLYRMAVQCNAERKNEELTFCKTWNDQSLQMILTRRWDLCAKGAALMIRENTQFLLVYTTIVWR